MDLPLAYLQLTLNNYKGQGQGYTHLDSEYLGNDDRYGKITIAIEQLVMHHACSFDWDIYI